MDVTKNRKFQHKIGYNSPYLRDITHALAPSRGFWWSACLKVTVRNCSDRPLLPWQQKFANFSTKNGYNSGCIRHITQIPAPLRWYSELAHLRASDKFAQTDPCCNGNDYKYKHILTQRRSISLKRIWQ